MTISYRAGPGLRLRVAKGLTGTAATITAGTTTTGAEGTSASVANSGTTAAAVFDFTIPRGAMPAVGWNFDTSTVDADPGAGKVRFNHATPASVTEIYFDNADRDGNDLSAWLDTFDDADTAITGTITFTPAASPAGKLVYNVTGAVTDGTGYRKVAVTHVAGTTLPSSAAHLGVTFARSADDGADGEMAGPGASVDGEIALYDGSGGATLKRASATGILKATSGVLSAASAGTDYLAPAAIGVTVQAYDADTTKNDVSNTFTGFNKIQATKEKWEIVADNLASGDNSFDVLTAAAWYWTTAGDTNATLNFRGDGSTTLNSLLAVNDSVTLVAIVTHTGTAYLINALKIDGSGVTPKWVDGTAPAAGSVNAIDVYAYTIIKTADATFTVLAQRTKWDEA